MRRMIMVLLTVVCTFATIAYAASSTTVGFDGGSDGGFTGNAYFEATGGNPGGVAHHFFDGFFTDLRTGAPGESANGDFLGNYTEYETVTFSFDIKTNFLNDFIGNPIARPIGIALKNHDITGPSGTAGVFIEMGVVGVNFTPEWTTLTVTIDDPLSPTLPAGWIGFGDEDPVTYEPILPAGVTFASILANVTEFDISGAVPGWFFGYAYYDVLIDNVTVEVHGNSVANETMSMSSVKSMFR